MSSKIRYILNLLLIFISFSIYAQQKYYTFSELRGLEDNSGNTHLFYRLYNYEGNYIEYSYSNNIYDLNLSNDSVKIFLYDAGGESLYISFAHPIKDYAFWNNDPSKYIFGGTIYGMESFAYLTRFDNANINLSGNFWDSGTQRIQISNQRDSILYAALPGLYKSTDGGLNWGLVDSSYSKYLVALSPFNDQVLFAIGQNGYLFKSVNGGNAFNEVDTLRSYYYSPINQILFDSDSLHLYKVSLFYNENISSNEYVFSVSSDGGESWHKKLTPFRKETFISNDKSKSGEIYIAEGRNIYISKDFGNTFSLFQKIDKDIKGLYKQKGTDNVYAITNYNLYKIIQNNYTSILNTPLNPAIFQFYPLEIDNKWVYTGTFLTYPSDVSSMIYTREVTDIKIMPNNNTYYEIKGHEKYGQLRDVKFYERIDSVNGRVYRYSPDSVNTGYEYLIDDLIAEKGDSVYSYRFQQNYLPANLSASGDTILFKDTVSYKEFDIPDFPISYKYVLANRFGLIKVESENDNRIYNYSLKSAIINGQIYGDTTLTTVENSKNSLPEKYNLSQNYPNPFNPTSIIQYEIPKSSFVILKVYDVLGREVATLVNELEAAGRYNITFDASKYSSGVYFYRIEAGSFSQIKKMVLLK